jgi:hypothetical protein
VPVLVVDVANVMGSRPDGWWRDRAGAATRLMSSLAHLAGIEVAAPGTEPDSTSGSGPVRIVRIERIVAVIEGRARTAVDPPGVEVVRAPADGDSAIVQVAARLLAAGEVPLVVTADRGLRARLPAGSRIAGPNWLLALS